MFRSKNLVLCPNINSSRCFKSVHGIVQRIWCQNFSQNFNGWAPFDWYIDWNSSNHLQCFIWKQFERRWISKVIPFALYKNQILFRLLELIFQINENFWRENEDNIIYKAVYMIFTQFTQLNPSSVFGLPLIEKNLEECANNTTCYSRWGEGKGRFMFFRFIFMNLK